MRLTRREVAAYVAVLALFLAFVAAVVLFVRNDSGRDLHSAWPESAEFAQLATGQERFSEHETNVEGTWVLVDHSTGAQYVVTGEGVCPLLDADGTPLLVAEAGE